MAISKKKSSPTTKPNIDGQKVNDLLSMLCNMNSLIISLMEDRETLQRHSKIIHDRWVSDVSLFDRQVTKLEMQILVEKTKAALLLGLKNKELLSCLRKSENLQSELDDFKAWFDILSHRSSSKHISPNKQDISPDELYKRLKAKDLEVGFSNGSSMNRCEELEKEVATLKHEYEKLSVEKCSSESTLRDQIKFVWNQYREMERKLLTKSNEVNDAREEAKKLLADIKQLQSSIAEKDISVETLKANIALLKDEVCQKDGEVTRLTKELESLKSLGPSGKPLLHHCSSKSSSSRSSSSSNLVETLEANISNLECEARQKDREIARLTKELESLKSPGTAALPALNPCPSVSTVLTLEASSRVTKHRGKSTDLKTEENNKNERSSKRKRYEPSSSSRGKETKRDKRRATSLEPAEEQVPRRSPRKRAAVDTPDSTPKLFTSQFKVPKLRTPSRLESC